jgi:NADPH:quinone reductase-like Zn-dependent oxidoreductase
MMACYLGAEIFVTVGTPKKRKLIRERYRIVQDYIFSSCNKLFAREILTATNGRGVNVVLNSLARTLLQESFNILAPFGCFVKISKQDLELNSHLEMRLFTC